MRDRAGNQSEPFQSPQSCVWRRPPTSQGLRQKNACAHQHQELHTRRDEAAPIELVAARAIRSAHYYSLRCQAVRVKACRTWPHARWRVPLRNLVLVEFLAREMEERKTEQREHEQ